MLPTARAYAIRPYLLPGRMQYAPTCCQGVCNTPLPIAPTYRLPPTAYRLPPTAYLGDGGPSAHPGRAGREVAAEDEVAGACGDVDEAPDAGGDVRPRGQARHVDAAVRVDLQEREQAAVEAAPLEVGELVGGGDDGLRVGGTPELEPQQGHPTDRPLLDHPGHGVVQSLFQQDARDEGREAEAEVDGVAVAEFHGRAPREDLVRPPWDGLKRRQRPAQLAADRWVVGCLRRLH